MFIAALLGAVIGVQRERVGKPAGLRTHMLVALGAALFMVGAVESGLENEGLAQVTQGISAGMGFIGAGAILKLSKEDEISGLTTAAGVWMTAAVGVTVGLGHLGAAVLSVVFTFIILSMLWRMESYISRKREAGKKEEGVRRKAEGVRRKAEGGRRKVEGVRRKEESG